MSMNFFAGGICTGFMDCGLVTLHFVLPLLPAIPPLLYLLYRFVRHTHKNKEAINLRTAVSYVLLANTITIATILIIDYPEAIAIPLFALLNLIALTIVHAQNHNKQD